MKVGDYVMYIGWNPDYNGKTGVIERLGHPEVDGHALIRFDQIIDKSRHAWWPLSQLKKIYTFDDLKFEEHPDFKSAEYDEFLKRQGRRKPDNLAEVANMTFDNGYSISVLFGVAFYSNGKDTYEIMCLDPNGNVLFKDEWGDEVLGNITSEEVTGWMIRLQKMTYQKRVFTAEDPYGEEEWDVNEGILEAKDVKVGDIVIYDPDLKPEKPHQVGCEASVVDINDKGVCKISFLDDNDTHYCHCDYLRWTGKKITDRRFTAEDPYGEEEWETNESAQVIKILYLDTLFDKYRLHINKLDLIAEELRKDVGNRVKPYAYFGNDRSNVKDIFEHWGYRILKDVSVKNNLVIYIGLEGVGDLIASDTLILHIKERVISDSDPYGEEEWEDTNEMRRGKFTPADHVIREINTIGLLQDITINYGRQHGEAPFGEQVWNEFTEYLRRRLLGKVCSFPVLGKNSKGEPEVHGAGHWTIDDIYLDDNFKVHFVGHGRNSDEKHDVILHIGKSITDVIYYEDKMIMSPEDPYGEEEWELESKLYESVRNLNIGDRVMYSPYNCEGTVVWKADDYSNEYMIEFDTPQPFAHNGKRGNAYEYGEFDPAYNDNRYYYAYGNTLYLIEGETPGKVRWYRKGKLHNESMITSFRAFRNL